MTTLAMCTRVYMLKHKSEVFDKFLEWKASVENSSGHKLKALRTDNGGEYVSNEMKSFLKKEGVKACPHYDSG